MYCNSKVGTADIVSTERALYNNVQNYHKFGFHEIRMNTF